MSKIQQSFTNDSFAIWLTGFVESYNFDVHINEWFNPDFNNFIDFGIRIYDARNLDTCNIFIPYDLTSNEIVDLSEKLSDESIARGIFNTYCSIRCSSNSSIIEIEYNNRKENILQLSSLQPKINQLNIGILLELSFEHIKQNLSSDELYIRFRLPHKTFNTFLQSKSHDYKFAFESPVVTDRYNYLIKLNDVRALPLEIRILFSKANQNIGKVITTLSANDQFIVDDSFCYKTRTLEEELYKNYVPDNFSCSNVIVYQWLSQNRSNYNFNIKIDSNKILKSSLCLYAFLIIFFSFIGNILWKLFTYIPLFRWLA